MNIRAKYAALPKRQQLIVLFAGPALLIIVLGYLVYQTLGALGPDVRVPAMLQRNLTGNLWEGINADRSSIEVQQKEANRKGDVQKQIASLDSDIKAARERLPTESEKTEMRSLIEKLARDIPSDIGSVQVLSVHISEEPSDASRGAGASDADVPHKVSYKMEISGDLNGIIKYIDVIEKNPRFMIVNSIVIKPGAVTQDADKKMVLMPHTVMLNLSTYFYKVTSDSGGGR
jgi:hypothetical protein